MAFDPNAAAAPDSGVFGLVDPPERCRVHLLPVPFEATTSYGGGTARGPEAIRAASRQVDLFDVETGKPYEAGIWMAPEPVALRRLSAAAKRDAAKVLAVGGAIGSDPALRRALDRVNAACERMNAYVHAAASAALDDGRIVGVVGGDHGTPFGLIRAVAERIPGVGILHVDAHADLRDAYEGFVWSHASIMHNVVRRLPDVARLVQVGIRDFCEEERDLIDGSRGRIRTHYDAVLAAERARGATWSAQCARIVRDLPRDVYVSFDVDGLDPTLCPHTGTPVPGGLAFHEASLLLGAVVASGRRIVAFDLNEVAPGPDDEWDANVGARLLYKLIGWTLRSQAAARSRTAARPGRRRRS